jgi:PTS system glucose-specific IIA component
MTVVTAPLAGRVIPLAETGDPVFSGGLMGPGVAIDPARAPGVAVAPVDGTVAWARPHAVVIVDGAGRGVLTHLGIDTVELAGEGFELLVGKGEMVTRGQPLIGWDPAGVEAAGKSAVCVVVMLAAEVTGQDQELAGVCQGADVTPGDTLFVWA